METFWRTTDLTLRSGRGELITLLGPSGCGKTTALRCITGQHRPDEGRVFIGEQDVTDLPTHRRELGMVFQNFALFPHMSVFQNVEFPLMIRGLSRDERRKNGHGGSAPYPHGGIRRADAQTALWWTAAARRPGQGPGISAQGPASR